MKIYRRIIAVAAVLLWMPVSGCMHGGARPSAGADSPEPASPAPKPSLAEAERLFQAGDYAGALIACVDAARENPQMPGLNELRNRIQQALLEQRARDLPVRADLSKRAMNVEAMEKAIVPNTYTARRFVAGDETPFRAEPTAMEQALTNRVTMQLRGASLSAVIDALTRDRQLNIVADEQLGEGRRIDVSMQDVPLAEVLDYVARNMAIRWYAGHNLIWFTRPDTAGGAPMETRLYRLKKGFQFHAGDWTPKGPAGEAPPGSLPTLTDQAAELSSRPLNIEQVIERFIPAVTGAQLYVDRATHVLLARNTRQNLALIEDIIHALDVVPPQVLIEARFIETTVADLRELGIDWALQSPLAVSKQTVFEDGRPVSANRSEIGANSRIGYTPYRTDGLGQFPLGPQGAFGLAREGNPPTANQGLNLYYAGILTEPMFQAVLHALDISGKGHTLSVPRVTTVNNNPAKLRNGEDLLYFDQFQAQAFNLVDANNQRYTVTVLIPSGKPVRAELGITLLAVPSVGADLRTISLLLMPSISRLEEWSSYQGSFGNTNTASQIDIQQVVARLPIISRKEVQTKVVVRSGETVVLGGLIDTVKQQTMHKVPFLSSIPLLGPLFQRLDVTEQNRNLLIFVTATVISDRGETLLPGPPPTSEPPPA